MAEIILFTVSILPVVLLGLFVYRKDKNKEPTKILTKLFLGGIFSCFLVLIVSLILGYIFPVFSADPTTLNLFELAIYVFIGVALVEEVCKWIFVYKISYNDKQFDEFYDIIIYSVFVALGFACFENLLYVYGNGVGTGIVRALLAVPGHACDGVAMGYYLGLAKISSINNRSDLMNKYMIFSVLVPTVLHGIYDYCLVVGNVFFILIFFIFVVILFVFTKNRLKQISSIKRKLKYKENYCPNCGRAIDSNFCPICGRKNE